MGERRLRARSTGLLPRVYLTAADMASTEGLIALTDAQQKASKDAFQSYDKKGESQIKVGDIASAMKKMGHNITPEFLEKWEEDIDKDGTGYVEYEEFSILVRRKIQEDEDERELKEIFRVLDKEKKGEVNTNELRWILKSLGEELTEEEIDDMIADVDTDGSGWVDYDEFSKLMMG